MITAPIPNPYTPGTGSKPYTFAGRQEQIRSAKAQIATLRNGDDTQGLVMTAPRGRGKTVLLRKLRDEAEHSNLIAALVTFDRVSNSLQLLARGIARALQQAVGEGGPSPLWTHLTERFKSLNLEISAGVFKLASGAPEITKDPEEEREILMDLWLSACRFARENGYDGFLLLIDEVQEASSAHLTVLSNAIQVGKEVDPTLTLFAAGLPEAPDKLMEAATFAERFEYLTLGPLHTADSEDLLVTPAVNNAVQWKRDALDFVLSAADGNPYFLQLFGKEVWNLHPVVQRDVFDLARVEQAIPLVRHNLYSGMFRGRWNKASSQEKKLLVAIANTLNDEKLSPATEYQRLMERSNSQLSMPRRRLIDKGIVTDPRRGYLQFTMPWFDDYILDELGERVENASKS